MIRSFPTINIVVATVSSLQLLTTTKESCVSGESASESPLEGDNDAPPELVEIPCASSQSSCQSTASRGVNRASRRTTLRSQVQTSSSSSQAQSSEGLTSGRSSNRSSAVLARGSADADDRTVGRRSSRHQRARQQCESNPSRTSTPLNPSSIENQSGNDTESLQSTGSIESDFSDSSVENLHAEDSSGDSGRPGSTVSHSDRLASSNDSSQDSDVGEEVGAEVDVGSGQNSGTHSPVPGDTPRVVIEDLPPGRVARPADRAEGRSADQHVGAMDDSVFTSEMSQLPEQNENENVNHSDGGSVVMLSDDEPDSGADRRRLRVKKRHSSSAAVVPVNEGEPSTSTAQGTDLNASRGHDESSAENIARSPFQLCIICYEEYTASGPHRIVSLACGHLFGQICIEKWLMPGNKQLKQCPNCKAKAYKRDIRVIYAQKLKAVDNCEVEQLRAALDVERRRVQQLETEKAQTAMLIQRLNEERSHSDSEPSSKRSRLSAEMSSSSSSTVRHRVLFSMELATEVNLDREQQHMHKHMRCMAFDSTLNVLVVGRNGKSAIFQSHGYNKLGIILHNDGTLAASLHRQFSSMHKLSVRDAAFSPSHDGNLLTGAMDKVLCISSVLTGNPIRKFTLPSTIWSVCWFGGTAAVCQRYALAGCADGHVYRCDLEHVVNVDVSNEDSNDGDCGAVLCVTRRWPLLEESAANMTPVVQLAWLQTGSEGTAMQGLIVAHLSAVHFYEYLGTILHFRPCVLDIGDGKVNNVSWTPNSSGDANMVVTFKPGDTHQHVRHKVYVLRRSDSGVIKSVYSHTYHGGDRYSLLTRNLAFNMELPSTCSAYNGETPSSPVLAQCYVAFDEQQRSLVLYCRDSLTGGVKNYVLSSLDVADCLARLRLSSPCEVMQICLVGAMPGATDTLSRVMLAVLVSGVVYFVRVTARVL